MPNIVKDLKFFTDRRKQAQKDGYQKPKVILVDIDGTVVKPQVRMFSMAEQKMGKKAIAQIEKERIRPLRKEMVNRKISFEKYLIELSKIDIEIGEYLEDYKNFFFDLVKRDLINIPMIKALGNLKKKDKVKVIFLTSNLKDYGDVISNNVLKLLGGSGKFDGTVGAQYIYNKEGKAVSVKSLISHDDAQCEGVKFRTKTTAINEYLKQNKIKVKESEVAVISDADTALMKNFGLGGLVYYPLKELSAQFKEIGYVMNARKGLYDFKVDYTKGQDLEIAQQKWEAVLRNPNLIRYSELELRKLLKNAK